MQKGAGPRTECTRIADLSRSGEYKPAVDAARDMEASEMTCPPDVQEAVSGSRAKLLKADSYVHKAVKRRKEGNLLSARANLDQALAIYPKYYWVQTLKRNVERSILAELVSLRNEASYFESRGDPEGALSRIQDAIKLFPQDQKLYRRQPGSGSLSWGRRMSSVFKARSRKSGFILKRAGTMKRNCP